MHQNLISIPIELHLIEQFYGWSSNLVCQQHYSKQNISIFLYNFSTKLLSDGILQKRKQLLAGIVKFHTKS